MTPSPVVLDVDTGIDDACALLLAAGQPGLEQRAVRLLRDVVLAAGASGQPITLIPLAPMTNIARFACTHGEAFAEHEVPVTRSGLDSLNRSSLLMMRNGCATTDLRSGDWAGDLMHHAQGPGRAVVDVARRIDGPRVAQLWLDSVGGMA